VPSTPGAIASKPERARGRVRRGLAWLCAGDRVIAVGMALLCAYYVIDRGVFQGKASGDGWFGFNYLKSIVVHGTLDMQAALPGSLQFFGVGGPGRHMPNRCPFGPVIVWLPFYLVAGALHQLAIWLHLTTTPFGNAPFDAWVTGLGTLAGTLVGWRYTYVLIERRLGRAAARLGSTAAVWATPIAWYTVTQPFYQHGLAFCFVAILVERWDARLGEASLGRFALLGAVGGLAMTMRAQEALYLLLPGGEALYHFARGPERRRWLVSGIVLSATAFVAFLPQLLVWRYYTGSLFQPAQVEPLRPRDPFLIVSLFSTRGGLFPWSPIAYAGALGLLAWRRARAVTLGLTAVFALEVYVVSSAWVVTGGYGFGARRLSDGAVLIGLGVGLALAWLSDPPRPRLRRALVGFTAFCLVLNLSTMELLRARRIASAGAYARTAEHFLDDELHLPRPIPRLFGLIGYPFVQPVGWLFALWHRVPAATFEGVVGNFFLDRDGQWFQTQTRVLTLGRDTRVYVIHGLAYRSDGKAVVDGPMRVMLPMFAREKIAVTVLGTIPAGNRAAVWNDVPVPVRDVAGGVRLEVPAEAVRAGLNELSLVLPNGAQLARMEFDSLTQWWRK
jgi:hypothetical protein